MYSTELSYNDDDCDLMYKPRVLEEEFTIAKYTDFEDIICKSPQLSSPTITLVKEPAPLVLVQEEAQVDASIGKRDPTDISETTDEDEIGIATKVLVDALMEGKMDPRPIKTLQSGLIKEKIKAVFGKLLENPNKFINSNNEVSLKETDFKKLEKLIFHKTEYKNKRVDQSLKKTLSIVLAVMKRNALPRIRNLWRHAKNFNIIEAEVLKYGEIKSGGQALKSYFNKLFFIVYFDREPKAYSSKRPGLAKFNEADSLLFIKNGVTATWVSLANNNLKKPSMFMREMARVLYSDDLKEEFKVRNLKMIENLLKDNRHSSGNRNKCTQSKLDEMEGQSADTEASESDNKDKSAQMPVAICHFDASVEQSIGFLCKHIPSFEKLL